MDIETMRAIAMSVFVGGIIAVAIHMVVTSKKH
jgi:hypothetical protein